MRNLFYSKSLRLFVVEEVNNVENDPNGFVTIVSQRKKNIFFISRFFTYRVKVLYLFMLLREGIQISDAFKICQKRLEYRYT